MCGIWAAINIAGAEQANHLQHHRGPDGSGYQRFEMGSTSIELAHRRLAIIDLDLRAAQPMKFSSREGTDYWLTYNGEIYNYLELRSELERLNYQFRTESDSEVLIAAIDAWGTQALVRFVGMFAFALLNLQSRWMLIARDAFGIKPLYFSTGANNLAVSSEIKPLLMTPDYRRLRSRVVEPNALFRYLRFGVTDDGRGTLFDGIEQLPAAHFAWIDIDRPTQWSAEAYWKADINRCELGSAEAALSLREQFMCNVQLHLRSDVPVGTALSGGLDSSAILAAARELQGPTCSIEAFTFVAAGSEVDEHRYALEVAQQAGVALRTVQIQPQELRGDLATLVELQEQPFGSTSIYAQYRVMQLAAEHGVKVMLDGQGADELFAGYRPYLAARLSGFIRAGQFAQAVRFLRQLRALPGASIGRWAAQALGLLAPDWIRQLGRKALGESVVPSWMDVSWFEQREVLLRAPSSKVGTHVLKERLLESLQHNVLPALLRYEDRNSMHFSIESRVPFLSIDMADLAYSLPDQALVSGEGIQKAAFREAMRGMVPELVLRRKDKIGFATPEREWILALRDQLRHAASDGFERLRPVLDLDAVGAYCDAVLDNRARFDFQAWRLFNLALWSERFELSYE